MQSNGQFTDLVFDFCEYTRTSPTTDMCRLWSGIAMVAGALERRVWLVTNSRRTYGNLYVLLVAPPGRGKGVIEDVRKFWQEAEDPDAKGMKCFHVASDSVTKASLIDEVDDAVSIRIKGIPEGNFKYQSLLIAAEEFEVLLPSYDPSFIATLDALYNNKEAHRETRRTGQHKVVELTRPQLNILGGVQPAYFRGHFPEYAWDTGLIRRIIMVYEENEPERASLFREQSNTPKLRQSILHRLGYIFDMFGEARLSNEAMDKLDSWHMSGGQPRPDHSKLQNYNTSRTEFVTKLSLISAVSRTNGMIVQGSDVDRAINWLLEAETRMPDVFRAMRGESDDMIFEALHYYVQHKWIANKKQPVHISDIIRFLLNRTPSQKIQYLIDVATAANYIESADGSKEWWLPLPKSMHGGME